MTWQPELSYEEAHDRIASGDLTDVRNIAHVLVNERRYLMEEMLDDDPEPENPSPVDPVTVLRFQLQALQEENGAIGRRVQRAIEILLDPPDDPHEARLRVLDQLGFFGAGGTGRPAGT